MEEFNYPTEQKTETQVESNPQILNKKNGARATCWYFCSKWTFRYERNTAAETLAVRKEKPLLGAQVLKLSFHLKMRNIQHRKHQISTFVWFQSRKNGSLSYNVS